MLGVIRLPSHSISEYVVVGTRNISTQPVTAGEILELVGSHYHISCGKIKKYHGLRYKI